MHFINKYYFVLDLFAKNKINFNKYYLVKSSGRVFLNFVRSNVLIHFILFIITYEFVEFLTHAKKYINIIIYTSTT